MTYKSYKIAITTFKHYLANTTYKKNFINWLTSLSYSNYKNLLSNNSIDLKTVLTYKVDTNKSFEIFLDIDKKLLLKKFLYSTKLHLLNLQYLKHLIVYNRKHSNLYSNEYSNLKLKNLVNYLNLVYYTQSPYYYIFNFKNNKFLTTMLLDFQTSNKYIFSNRYFYKTVSNLIYLQNKQYLSDLIMYTLLKQKNNINLPIIALQKYYLLYTYYSSLLLTPYSLKKNNVNIFFKHNYLIDF